MLNVLPKWLNLTRSDLFNHEFSLSCEMKCKSTDPHKFVWKTQLLEFRSIKTIREYSYINIKTKVIWKKNLHRGNPNYLKEILTIYRMPNDIKRKEKMYTKIKSFMELQTSFKNYFSSFSVNGYEVLTNPLKFYKKCNSSLIDKR